MKSKLAKTVVIVLLAIFLVIGMIWCAAKCVFLLPSCYSDNKNLTEEENYFIKKLVLESIEARLSIFADGNTDFETDEEQENRKHFFVLINSNFMDSVTKDHNGYTVNVQTYFMEPESDDCLYEIHLTKDFSITSFALDP